MRILFATLVFALLVSADIKKKSSNKKKISQKKRAFIKQLRMEHKNSPVYKMAGIWITKKKLNLKESKIYCSKAGGRLASLTNSNHVHIQRALNKAGDGSYRIHKTLMGKLSRKFKNRPLSIVKDGKKLKVKVSKSNMKLRAICVGNDGGDGEISDDSVVSAKDSSDEKSSEDSSKSSSSSSSLDDEGKSSSDDDSKPSKKSKDESSGSGSSTSSENSTSKNSSSTATSDSSG